MNHILFSLLFITTQPMFCGGVVSCCQVCDQEDDVSTDDERPLSRSWQISPHVVFECDPDNGKIQFKIEAGDIKFDWEDPQAKGECNALKRRLAQEKDPVRRQVLNSALATALRFKHSWDRFKKECSKV